MPTRCPKGTHKNRSGVCVQKDLLHFYKRCPNGTRRNKSGDCEKKPGFTKEKSPRKTYARRYFKTPPTLLGSEPLFQVSFRPRQFKNYVNLAEDPKMDCFIQSLFSLGLRNVDVAKKEVVGINQNATIGVSFENAEKYIADSFSIPRTDVNSRYILTTKESGVDPKKSIGSFLDYYLLNNYATILILIIHRGEEEWGHYIVAYKHKDKVYFFDPQAKGFEKYRFIHSTNINTLMKHYVKGDPKIVEYGYFSLSTNVVKSMPLLNDTCPIEYEG
jgi:hypothetical protein